MPDRIYTPQPPTPQPPILLNTKQSTSVKDLAMAMAKFQAKPRRAVLDSKNPHFRSRYASRTSVLDAVLVDLGSLGVWLSQHHHTEDNTIVMTTTLRYGDQYIEYQHGSFPITGKVTAHSIGSALTYSSRYALCLIFALPVGGDDDGNAATGEKTRQTIREVKPRNVEDLRHNVLTAAQFEASLRERNILSLDAAVQWWNYGLQNNGDNLPESVMDALKRKKLPPLGEFARKQQDHLLNWITAADDETRSIINSFNSFNQNKQ